MHAVVGGALALAACYRPAVESCQYACDDDGGCPAGLACNAARMCAATATATCDGSPDGGRPDGGGGDGGLACWTAANIDLPCSYFGSAGPVDWTLGSGILELEPSCATTAGTCGVPVPVVLTAQHDGSAVLVIAADHVSIPANASLFLEPGPPVVILAYGGADIAGTIFANAVDQNGDPQAMWASGCPSTMSTIPGAGGGGGGGGFGEPGAGSGGAGPGGMLGGPAGEPFGASLQPLVGGCPGGDTPTTTGGHGGGVLELSSRGDIVVSGVLNAPGGGGRSTQNAGSNENGTGPYGGGGGGAGGGILLDGATVTIEDGADVCANGGGGGAGGFGQAGDSDECGSRLAPTGGAPGVNLTGGAGGNGAIAAAAATDGDNNGNGGGGGGGATGRIVLMGRTGAGVTVGSGSYVSPTALVVP